MHCDINCRTLRSEESMKTVVLFLVFVFLMVNVSLAEPQADAQTTTEASAAVPVKVDTTTTSNSSSSFDNENDRSKFGILFFSIGGIDRSQLTDGSGNTPSMYFFEDFLAFSYKVSKDFRISARYSFNYSTSGTDKFNNDVNDKADTRDMSLLLSWANVFEDYLPDNMVYKFQPRLYLPTSEKSKAEGLISSLRLENESKIFLSRHSYFRLWLAPHYFFERSTAYTNDKGKPRATEMFAVKHGAEFSYDLNKTFALKPGFEVEDTWSNSSSSNMLSEFRGTNIDYRFGLEIKVAKPLSFTIGYDHKKDLIKTDEYADGFTLMTIATLY